MQEVVSSPLVSVVLPAFNAGKYLDASLRSVLNQTFGDFEIILLDNASTDDTAAVAAGFADPRLRYYRNVTNIGYAGNVERGRGLATAPYVAVFNADDVWEATYLAKAIAVLRSNPNLAFVHTRITLTDEHGKAYGEGVMQWRPITAGHEAFLNCFLAGFSSPTMLIRNDILRTVAPLPTAEPWGKVADSWFFLQLCLRGDVGFIAEPLLRYRVHATSMMSESYADGSFFRRRLACVREAFTWPEVRAWASANDRRRVTRHIGIQAMTFLPAMRAARTRAELLSAFGHILHTVPRVGLHPMPWIRLAYGLLPRDVIATLRARKRQHWTRRNSDPMPSQ